MRILLLTDSYPPEIRSASHLMHEFANALKDRGHKVTVVTTMPRYNLTEEYASIPPQDIADEDGITVIRTKGPRIHNVGYLRRGLAHLILPYVFYRSVRQFVLNRPDLIVVYSPPLTLGAAGIWTKKRFSCKLILNIQDIFPQNAIDLDIMNNRLAIKFFESIERWIYKRVDRITVHSGGNKEFLIQRKHLLPDQVVVIYNWIHCYKTGDTRNNCRQLHNVDSKFTILFAGILGPAQGLDVIINVAEKLHNRSNAHFLFVGDGTAKKNLKNKAQKLKLSNVSFQPFVCREDYPFLLEQADVGLVCLSKHNKTPVVPGKLMGYMAGSLPVVAVLNRESDGHDIVKRAKCGFSLLPDDEDGIADAILTLESDNRLRMDMGKSGLEFAHNYFSLEYAVNIYEKIFRELLEG